MKFRSGNKLKYSQDFRQCVGVPVGIEFEIEIINSGTVRLKAPNYGDKPYGNGAIILYRSMNKHIRWSRILAVANHEK